MSQPQQQNYSVPNASHPLTQAGHKVDTVWFRFLSNLYVATGSGNAATTLPQTQAAVDALQAIIASAPSPAATPDLTRPFADLQKAVAAAAIPQPVMADLQRQIADLQRVISATWKPAAPLFPSYDMAVYVPGLIGAPTYALWRFIADRPFVLPVGLFGSRLACATAPTGAVSMNLQRNGSTIGTLNIAGAATTGTFTFTTRTTVLIGDILAVNPPASADATLASLNWTFAGQRLA